MSITIKPDPFDLFNEWFQEAQKTPAIEEPTAMTLATVDPEGMPAARIVLLKAIERGGFTFYTNLGSVKAQHLRENPRAALCFHWMPLEKQVRVQGVCTQVSDEEADAYFASRPKQSQIGAWASKQSQPYHERLELEKRVALFAAKYALSAVPRPEFWSGFHLEPSTIEFWLKQPYRLHDRVRYTRVGGQWQSARLFP
ncbi:MAG: pyridoxamine 5'-phosphate oxidase [Candidatus Hydrogenedentes bacterium]|nr:pyridoxamine 5'-phosphate oxidase [Candidatus Hydrogenedentota bacterium]